MNASDKAPEEPLLDEDALPSFEDDIQWIDQDSAGIASDRSARPNRRRGGSKLWMLIKALVFLTVIALILLGVAAFFARDLIIARAEARLLSELEKNGVYLSYENPTWDFRRGLVVEKATLFESEKNEKPLIALSNLGIRVDLYQLLRSRSADAAEAEVTTRDATLTFYAAGAEVAKVERFNSRLFGDADILEIDQAEALVNGLEISAEGMIKLAKTPTTPATTPEDAEAESAAPAEPLDFGFLREIGEWVRFSAEATPPQLALRLAYDPTNAQSQLAVDGILSGQAFSWRDVPFDAANIAFAYQGGAQTLALPAVSVIYEGGMIDGSVVYDLVANQMRISELRSTADVLGFAQRFGVTLPPSLSGIEFDGAPELAMRGLLDLGDVLASDLRIEYEHWQGMSVPVGEGRILPVTALRGDFLWKDRSVSTEKFIATVLSGDVEVAGKATLGEALSFDADAAIDGLSLQAMFDFLEVERTQPGRLTATFEGRGTGEIVGLNGAGTLRVADGELYKVPVIGPIQDVLATAVAVFGQRTEGELTASYAVDSGILRTEDLVAKSDGTKIRVAGEVDLTEQTADFSANANLAGPLGLATGLVSQLLEVQGSGPLDDLSVQLKGVPAEFAGDAVKGMLDLAGGASGAVGGIASEATEKATSEVKKLGSGLNKMVPNRKAVPLPAERANGDPVTAEEMEEAVAAAEPAPENTAGLVGPPDPATTAEPVAKPASEKPEEAKEPAKPTLDLPAIPLFSD